jgi:hypothetical protein
MGLIGFFDQRRAEMAENRHSEKSLIGNSLSR